MAVGTTAAVLLGLGGLGAGVVASKMMAPKAQVSAPLPLPQPPSTVNAEEKGAAIAKSKRASATQSVYTSPLGVAGEANVARKTLLGQ